MKISRNLNRIITLKKCYLRKNYLKVDNVIIIITGQCQNKIYYKTFIITIQFLKFNNIYHDIQ